MFTSKEAIKKNLVMLIKKTEVKWTFLQRTLWLQCVWFLGFTCKHFSYGGFKLVLVLTYLHKVPQGIWFHPKENGECI